MSETYQLNDGEPNEGVVSGQLPSGVMLTPSLSPELEFHTVKIIGMSIT